MEKVEKPEAELHQFQSNGWWVRVASGDAAVKSLLRCRWPRCQYLLRTSRRKELRIGIGEAGQIYLHR